MLSTMTASAREATLLRCRQTLNNIQLRYLAEGNANVIFSISNLPDATTPDQLSHVLRLRKDLPFTKPCVEVISDFRSRVVPLFEPNLQNLLLQQSLVKLTPEIVDQANEILHEKEDDGTRHASRCGVFLPIYEQESYGIIMPNLCQNLTIQLIEFKPKWLLQSPSAPSDAVRCRTCALNAVRRMKEGSKGRGDSGFCPLNLLSTSKTVISSLLMRIDQQLGIIESMPAIFMSTVQPALRHLKILQDRHNKVGLHDFRHPEGKDFSLAMALRDCSCFLVVDTSDKINTVQDFKFADLDLKTTEGGKLDRWTAIEEQLLSSGAYTKPDLEQQCALRHNSDAR